MKRFLTIVAVVLAVGGAAYYYLFLEYGSAMEGAYRVDMMKVRELANAASGAKPVAINAEHVDVVDFPDAAVIVGGGWRRHEMVIYSFEVMYPFGHVLIDTSVTEDQAKEMVFDYSYDPLSFERMDEAMNSASMIVFTHEHMDHVGGLAASPNFEKLIGVAKFTREQLAFPARMAPVSLPAVAMREYQPLDYDTYYPIAPGMVLIKAPGHSPGSQMIYVQLQNGKEYLFVGDIAWHADNYKELRPRPRLVSSFMLKEDRQMVLNELFTIRQISEQVPDLAIVVSHDGDQVRAYQDEGLIGKQFE